MSASISATPAPSTVPAAAPASASAAPAPAPVALRTPVILGSSSKWRAQVIREMGITVERCLNPNIDEYAVTVEGSSAPRHLSDPGQLSTAVASAKASYLLTQIPRDSPTESLLVTSDQVAFFEEAAAEEDGGGVTVRIREKPRDAAQCREWFAQYSSSPIRVVTAVIVTRTRTARRYVGTCYASQKFLSVPPEVLEVVIAQGDILGCCGGFMVDAPELLPYLGAREGTEDELIGLPKKLLTQLLQQAQADIDREEASDKDSKDNSEADSSSKQTN